MTDSHDEMRKAAWAAVIVSAVLIGQQVAGRALRDGFFLMHFPASTLPSVMTAASILSVAIVFGTARLLRRFAPWKSLPVFFAGNAALYAVEWAVSGSAPRVAAALLYLHTTSVGAVVVSGFWSVVNERFDPYAAKALVARIGIGASIGGVLGGLFAWGGASALEIPTLILVLASLNALCALAARRIGGPERRVQPAGESHVSALEIFQETPYLRHLALLVALAAFTGAVYDYVFKAHAAERFSTGPELVSFFALFYLSLSVATLVVQNLLARRFLLGLGLAITVGTLPGIGAAFGLIALLAPGIWTAGLMRGGTSVVESSLYRSGYELLYTPVLPEKKRPTKTLIDVGGDKLGGAAGGAFAFFVLGIFPGAASPILMSCGIAAAVAALFVTRRLHQGYVSSLAESLRTGSLSAADVETLDATTQQTVANTIVAMERNQVLGELAKTGASASFLGRDQLLAGLRASGATDASQRNGRRPYVDPPRQPIDPAEIDETVGTIVELRSGDPVRIVAALARNNPLPDSLVGHVISLLDDDSVAEAASLALRKVAPANTGALLDAVLHTRTPLDTRRRVCEILSRLPTQRCADGLVLLLEDHDFELRFRAAAGLLEIVRVNARLRIPREPVFEAAEREAIDCARRWRYQTSVDPRLTRVAPSDSSTGKRVLQGGAYIFSLLLSVLDPDPLRLAIRALASTNSSERGTGLEYMGNVLPPGLREAVWPLLTDPRLAQGGVRARSQLLADLGEQAPLGPVDLAALRRRIDAQRNQL